VAGILYGVGIGPGDPELITVKAKRILSEADVIAVPKPVTDGRSTALAVAAGAIGEGKEILELHFPMSIDEEVLEESRNRAAAHIKYLLGKGRNVAFITLGDPTVYSTYMYIHRLIKKDGYQAEIIPGVTSFSASAARAGISLGEGRETIAVIPSAYECEDLEDILESFDNIVFMKVSGNLDKLRNSLIKTGLLNNAVLVSRCGMKNEKITDDLDMLDEGEISYFSTVIVKKSGVK